MWLWPAATDSAARPSLRGGGAVVDPHPVGRSGEDRSARCPQPGEVASGWRAHAGVGS